MVIYDLCCEQDHRFEGWFRDSEDLRGQVERGLLVCPVCDSNMVRKLPTVAKVSRLQSSGQPGASVEPDAKPASRELMEYRASQEFLRRVHDYVDSNFIDVGTRFAEEARKIHTGEAEERGIRGIASAEQVKALREDGIHTLPLPARPPDKKKLN